MALILQWMSKLVSDTNNTKVSLPISFPNALLNVQVATSHENEPAMAGSGDAGFHVTEFNKATVTVFLQYWSSMGIRPSVAHIFAIGH